jgi:uncharacterized cupin superfamily protein
MGLVHWDDVEGFHRAAGEMDATWQALGDAAGVTRCGVQRVRVAPGKLPTPPHEHMRSEEVFFVLSGSGLLWHDGAVHELRPNDCVIHRARTMAHTLIAGPDGLEYLVFGTRERTEAGWLPRSGALRIGPVWVQGRDDDPWDVEETVAPLELGEPQPRPANIVNVDEVELDDWQGKTLTAALATRDRTDLAGFHWERINPGRTGSYPHVHSAEEEVFVILEGSATLHLDPAPLAAELGVRPETHDLRPGHVVVRPPGSRVAHWFRAGDAGCTMLIYGTRDPNDMVFYPRSNKIFFRGLGVVARVEPVPYDDGEPDD